MPTTNQRLLIEPATAADAEAMAALWVKLLELLAEIDPTQFQPVRGAEGYADYLRDAMLQQRITGFVARVAGQAVGFIFGQIGDRPPHYRVSRYAAIDELYVETACRQTGIGTGLVQTFEAWARSRGVLHIELSSHLRNPWAQSFWERRGYAAYADFRRRELS